MDHDVSVLFFFECHIWIKRGHIRLFFCQHKFLAGWRSLHGSSLWFCRGCWLLFLSLSCSLLLSLLGFLFLHLFKDLRGRKQQVKHKPWALQITLGHFSGSWESYLIAKGLFGQPTSGDPPIVFRRERVCDSELLTHLHEGIITGPSQKLQLFLPAVDGHEHPSFVGFILM